MARKLGVSRQCGHRWVRRFRDGGMAGFADRSSRPHRVPSRTPAEAEDRVVAVRARLRCGPARVSAATGGRGPHGVACAAPARPAAAGRVRSADRAPYSPTPKSSTTNGERPALVSCFARRHGSPPTASRVSTGP
ncbi:hypothetical protein BN6_74000 [Saccharothrix espanaensis DSM 44229]|uniref:Uncharacterized protein n=1 Tax=Saccharothrix espanaensis (strain ATCC 51144 / DSM 44229 / JCM 9112 / NBRC 15066 / NRRL 15764) TaxID=1179773 RepID=K0KCZ1_SACES|nr:hypothetical protein BN6_74000 [Saccharothrix espanaensis DSM 44229]